MNATPTLCDLALSVINEPNPGEKVRRTRNGVARWRAGEITTVGHVPPPARPARPDKPELIAPQDMPRRSKSGEKGRRALLHALAHIELNAIDLAWDIIVRFVDENLPRDFFDDWASVALDEAEHFDMLETRLHALGSAYGTLPAHDGLWEAAENTAHDLLARLALVPMVLEARGLDASPPTIHALRRNGDDETAQLLDTIMREEIPHVAAGVRWFEYLCHRRELPAVETFHSLVRQHFKGTLKPPFNTEARTQAGMRATYYESFTSS